MLNKFIELVDRNKYKVDSIIVTVDGVKYGHNFTPLMRRNIRSLSKLVSSLGISKAIDAQLIGLDSFVMPYFHNVDIYNEKNRDYLSRLKIKHLLTLSIGHDKSFMLRRNYEALPIERDNISYILNQDIVHEPGTFLVYDNAATYLLSAIMEAVTNKPFDVWVYETVLKHLEIEKARWDKSNQGICLGATGLYLNNEEVHRIGMLLLNNGKYGDKQIINDSWIDSMHEPHIINPNFERHDNVPNNKLKKVAYGYHIWVCKDGSGKHTESHYFADGAEGKYLIISPEQKMVISVLSREPRMNLLTEALGRFL